MWSCPLAISFIGLFLLSGRFRLGFFSSSRLVALRRAKKVSARHGMRRGAGKFSILLLIIPQFFNFVKNIRSEKWRNAQFFLQIRKKRPRHRRRRTGKAQFSEDFPGKRRAVASGGDFLRAATGFRGDFRGVAHGGARFRRGTGFSWRFRIFLRGRRQAFRRRFRRAKAGRISGWCGILRVFSARAPQGFFTEIPSGWEAAVFLRFSVRGRESPEIFGFFCGCTVRLFVEDSGGCRAKAGRGFCAVLRCAGGDFPAEDFKRKNLFRKFFKTP